MIENANDSKNPSGIEYPDIPKYVGVASVNIKAINPSNAVLRNYGWTIPEDAEEPKYVTVQEKDGKPVKSARVRFLVQIQDLDDKPVISLDFWVRPEIMVNKDGDKCKIIDAHSRTAWGTKEEVTSQKIPQYESGQANISIPYKPCHGGEEELVSFLFKYLNITPFEVFSKAQNKYIPSKNPGRLTIDRWNDLCDGRARELADYVASKPDNRVKVILGVRTTDDNKAYQTFLGSYFLSNGLLPDKLSGEYTVARKAIDKFFERRENNNLTFSAKPVSQWNISATEVVDNSESISGETLSFDGPGFIPDDDLPFGD